MRPSTYASALIAASLMISHTAYAGLWDIASQVGGAMARQQVQQAATPEPAPTAPATQAVVNGQTVNLERMQMTDNRLTCEQIKSEVDTMNLVINSSADAAASNQTASAVSGVTTEVAANAAMAAAARNGSSGLGFLPIAHAIGGSGAADTSGAADAAAQAEAARARKEHLVEMYLKKECM